MASSVVRTIFYNYCYCDYYITLNCTKAQLRLNGQFQINWPCLAREILWNRLGTMSILSWQIGWIYMNMSSQTSWPTDRLVLQTWTCVGTQHPKVQTPSCYDIWSKSDIAQSVQTSTTTWSFILLYTTTDIPHMVQGVWTKMPLPGIIFWLG